MRALLFFFSTLLLIGVGNYMEGGHTKSLFHLNTFLIVLGPVLSYLIYANGIKGIGSFLKRVTKGNLLERDEAIVHNSITLGLLTGTFGVILGFIHIFENLSDPTRVGPGVAMLFVSIFYGALPSLFLIPFSHIHSKSHLQKVFAYVAVMIPAMFATFYVVMKAIET